MRLFFYIKKTFSLAMTGAIMMLFSGCIVLPSAIEGKYEAVTDFSREVVNMSGQKQTIVYENGKSQFIRFLGNHEFVRSVKYSSDRVNDVEYKGYWKWVGWKKVEVTMWGNRPKEYYKILSNTKIIRLDINKKRLPEQYIDYFTFNRVVK